MYVLIKNLNLYLIIVLKDRNDALKKIEEETIKISELKINVMNELYKKREKKEKKEVERRYLLITNLEGFGIYKIFIGKFLLGLWNYPEAIYKILKGAELENIQTNLGPLIIEHFFINYLSGNYIENNLLYILTLMIRDEIEQLKSPEQVDTFLDNTRCGYLLEELQKKADIQLFFNKVILEIIEDLEIKCSSKEFKLNAVKIEKEFMKLKKDVEGDKKKKSQLKIKDVYQKICDKKLGNNNQREATEKSTAFCKYAANMNSDDLEKKAESAKNENNNDLSEYFLKFALEIKNSNDKDLYSNKKCMDSFSPLESPEISLLFYQDDFLQIKEFLEKIINALQKHILLLPYSVKCLCKIISVLIRNKFKNISKAEENGFISKFFFGRLFIPIMRSPALKALISEFVISGNTINNLEIINIVLNKLFSGKLFKNIGDEIDYTPFNWFFLDNMKTVLSFYENCNNVNLPVFIEKFINNNLPKEYKYDFFEENKEEIYANISICFNLLGLIQLIEGAKNCPDIFNEDYDKAKRLQKAYEKLTEEDAINNIKKKAKEIKINILKKEKEEEEKNKGKENTKDNKNPKNIEIVLFFLYLDKNIEKQYENLFKLDNNQLANFYIDIKKDKEKLISEEERIIINVKNYLSCTLGNYRILNIADFHKESTSDIKKMLTEIKAYMVLPNFIINNNTIPSNWFMDSLLNYLDKLPQEYKNNDYEELFKEIGEDISESIDDLDFQRLIMFRNKLKFIDKMSNYYSNVSKLIENIFINEKVKNIVEIISIPVEIYFKYFEKDNKENIFAIKAYNAKDKVLEGKTFYEDPKKGTLIMKTIEAFTTHFPDLTKFQLYQDKNPIEILSELNFLTIINQYFEIIKEKLIKREKIPENEYAKYQEKIQDYIMNKIYEKIYPPEYSKLDNKIFQITTSHSWIEPQMLVDKKYTYDSLLPDILNEYKQLHNVKNPFKKIKSLRKIMDLISNLIKFNENKTEIGSDDVTPVLMYTFIKAHPERINSDLEFIKIFLPPTKGQADFDINQLEGAYNYVLSLSAERFKLTQEEYDNKCANA